MSDSRSRPQFDKNRLGAAQGWIYDVYMRHSTFGLAVFVVAMTAISCKVYDESMLLPAEAAAACPLPGGQTQTLGIGWWSGCDQSGACFSARAPGANDRPAKSDPGVDLPPIFFGFRSMRLGSRNAAGELDKNAWQDIGFDLDGVCTAAPTCPTQGEPPVSCKVQGNQIPVDGNYCRDNTFGRLEYMVETTPEFGKRFRLGESSFNCSICGGEYNFVFRVTGYNGQANDNSVRVDIYPSPGLTAHKPGIDCNAGGWDPGLCWTRDDVWTVQRAYVPSGQSGPDIGDSSLYDPGAFVRDHVLVVGLRENTVFWFPSMKASASAFPMILQEGIVTGRLVQTSTGWTVTDGMVSGRMIWTDALDGFRKLGLCEGDPLFEGARLFAKTSPDLLSTGAVLPDTDCDSISVGISFIADEAQVGPLQDVPELVPCADAGAPDTVDGG